MFLDNGFDVDLRNKRGETLLHQAVKYNQVEIVQMLLQKGADKCAIILSTRKTALQIAVSKGYDKIVNTLQEDE